MTLHGKVAKTALGRLVIDPYWSPGKGLPNKIVTAMTPPISIVPLNDTLWNETGIELPAKYRNRIYMSGTSNYNAINVAAGKLRGVPSVIQNYRNKENIYPREAVVYECEYFSLSYFPTDHFLSLFRKSRPAICIVPLLKLPFNGEVLPKGINWNQHSINSFTKVFQKDYNLLLKKYPSILPKDYAYIRRKVQLITKRAFIEEWCKLDGDKAINELRLLQSRKVKSNKIELLDLNDHNMDMEGHQLAGVAKDGFYQYNIYKYPSSENLDSFKDNIKKSVTTVADLDMPAFLKTKKGNPTSNWVDRDNDKIFLKKLNLTLKQNNMPLLSRNVSG